MSITVSYIHSFLRRWEGRETVAYIPCRERNFTGSRPYDEGLYGDVIGASGVTVGCGLDLGRQSERDLARMGLAPDLVALFRPYLGKSRDDAVKALADAPLTLTDAQCDAVNDAAHNDYIKRAASAYDRARPDAPFSEIPAQAQAVIVSLFYQLGAGVAQYPKTWRHLLNADWEAAARALETGFARFTTRRADEARLLREIA